MHMTKLRAVGGSVMFAIPKSILEGLGLAANTQVGVSVTEGRLIVDPHPRPRYTLDQLLSQCDMNAQNTVEDAEWMNDALMGNEGL